jgi:hypothetical protein
MLPRNVKEPTTGREDRQPWAGSQEVDEQWRGGGDLLEVVEHQQQVTVAHRFDQPLGDRSVSRFAQPERSG